jgi:rare lipoprotein A
MKHIFAVLSLMLLLSCAATPPVTSIPETGTTYVTASWYGTQFNGRPTSSGERYDMYGHTAAHKTMKFGTRLRVTNPDTDQSVDVIVNDRGPFIAGRDLDLSFGAARAIGFDSKGVGRVKIEFLGRDMRYSKRIAFTPSKASVHGGVTIQLGSFANELYADRLKEGLKIKYKDVYITTVSLNGIEYYRVRIGKFDTYERAYSFAEKLADEGYNTFITSID